MHLQDLRLSPLGCVPQHERRPRIICDYSFYNVNQETEHLAPPKAMQFGPALRRVLWYIAWANPKYGPVKMSKIDVSDGFYRLRLRVNAIAALGLLLPIVEDEPWVAFPLVLPMGWTESPPAFCVATETVTDLANWSLQRHEVFPKHRLEDIANTLPEDYEVPASPVVHGPLSP